MDKKTKKIPKCNLEWREGKAVVVCDTKADQKIAYEMVVEGIIIEVKPDKVVTA
ncbi:unnamed protein product [marine sediment metagenome]|uniref:Uncharacterized protein n=1 Tax=marine sediment metagenome TaxID=412755 RepID=X1N864_9ZZZZ